MTPPNSSLEFEVSAPGKVILHGEHSVVYGHPAVAGPIGLRTYLRCSRITSPFDPEPMVVLKFDAIPFTSRVTLASFNVFLAELDCHGTLQPQEYLEQIRSTGGPFPRTQPEGTKEERLAVGATMYIINRVLRAEGIESIDPSLVGPGGLKLSFSSEMSIGAGLGSSASFGVCLAAGAYALSRVLQGQPVAMDHEKVSRWAFDSEVIMHEKPSGLDNTIATYGKLIRFCRGETEHKTVALRHPVHILIVDSGCSRSTAEQVATSARRRELYPLTMGSILDAMGALADEAIGLYESDDEPTTVYERLSTLVSINNNLLRSLGVSHPALEKIFALAEQHGFRGCKLTGAGGGGCAFVLLPANYREHESFRSLDAALRDAGFATMETSIADGQGVSFRFTGDDQTSST